LAIVLSIHIRLMASEYPWVF